MSESPTEVPAGPGKPEKKGRKKKWFFLALVAAVIAGGVYLVRNIDDEPPHGPRY